MGKSKLIDIRVIALFLLKIFFLSDNELAGNTLCSSEHSILGILNIYVLYFFSFPLMRIDQRGTCIEQHTFQKSKLLDN